jgi:tetratricopeptide (TPR) repeat protein/DNA-binding SARP family transcriptional activator
VLTLLDSPQWQADDRAQPARLPATLPACLMARLVLEARWIDRLALAAVFWPDAEAAEASHNLRVNLHRLRELLDQLGIGRHLLQAERTRVRLLLPNDVAGLRHAAKCADGPALLRLQARAVLAGLRLPGFGDFEAWADAQVADIRRCWARAAEAALETAIRAADAALAQALVDAAPDDARATIAARLSAMEFAPMNDEARACWRALRARLGPLRVEAGTAPQPVAGREALQRRMLDSPALALAILGEAGVGKTTMLAASHPGAVMLRGREGLQAQPYRPVHEWLLGQMDALRALLAQPGSPLAAYRLDLARLLPDLAPDEPLPPLDALTAKARLFEALSRVFEALAPLLLIDDLQWCDDATLEWLSGLTHGRRLRWRATVRRHEICPTLQRLMKALESEQLLHTLQLGPLDIEGVGLACRQRWPERAWTPQDINRLHDECAGNPFLLCELVAAQADAAAAAAKGPRELPVRVQRFVGRRIDALPPPARRMVQAAAVLAQPAHAAGLATVATGAHSAADGAADAAACELALEAGLLRECPDGRLECGHDLIRTVAYASLSGMRRQWMHRMAARWLQAAAPADHPLAIARHWQLAGDDASATPWWMRAAEQARARGQYHQARELWTQVAAAHPGTAEALWARLGLAECALADDLSAGRQAYAELLDDLGSLADRSEQTRLQARLLAGLVDNLVFAGETRQARQVADRLVPLLPSLAPAERLRALEVLIELTMREPDLPAATRYVEKMQRLAPSHPMTASMAAQVHWVSGDVQRAAVGFEALLAQHPDWCSGLTIENDLAVMLHALGHLQRAETMARRSLESWQGVTHTQALSRLVLGSVLTSMGRYDEAHEVLQQALALARAQTSKLFESEALMRLTRVLALAGQVDRAVQTWAEAAPMLADDTSPLKISQGLLAQAACAEAADIDVDPTLLARLDALCRSQPHPLAQARLARAEFTAARRRQDWVEAEQAARRLIDTAQHAGLQEWLAEGWLLAAELRLDTGQIWPDLRDLLGQALKLAQTEGMRPLEQKAMRLSDRAASGQTG